MDVMLQAKGVEKVFGSVRALRSLEIAANDGQIHGLVGPDGAGKTTAIRILSGLMAPTKGQVSICGFDPMRQRDQVRDVLGYMPQQYSLYGDLSVEENLSFFADMFCLTRKEYRERRDRLLSITRLEKFSDRRADALSGGMYKKLALSASLLHRPRVLLLDEPTNGVDPVSRREFWDLLREFVVDGMTVLISTPYMDEAARCHQVSLLHEGRVIEEGIPADLLAAFPHTVLRVIQGDRDAIAGELRGHAAVIAMSPSGARMRVVVRTVDAEEIARLVRACGGEVERATPDFEDLFLAKLQEAT